MKLRLPGPYFPDVMSEHSRPLCQGLGWALSE